MAKRGSGNIRSYHTQDDLEKAKQVYITSTVPLKALSNQSRDIIGVHIPFSTIREVANKENWQSLRSAYQGENVDDIVDQITHIGKILYQQIVLQSLTGLTLTGNFDEDRVIGLLKSIPGLEVKRGTVRSVDSSLVRAYMDLISKANINITMQSGSGKTSFEQALEIAQQAIAEVSQP